MGNVFPVGCREFGRIVASSIRDGLSKSIGLKCCEAVVKHFLRESGLKRLEDVVECPEKFEEFMGNLFGKGSVLLLNRIGYELCQRLRFDGSLPCDGRFASLVHYLEQTFAYSV